MADLPTKEIGPAALTSPACVLCGSAACLDLGPLRYYQPTMVGSVVIDISDLQVRLKSCERCRFQFSHPRIPPERLLACYAETAAEHWSIEVDPLERRYDFIGELLQRHARGRRILDVGCFTGSLLAYMGSSWDRFGVEPSTPAVAAAEKRGIKILGATLDDIPPNAEPFDVIVAVDVIEHINDPIRFFRGAISRLRPGGVLLLVTGDTGSPTWRLMKNRYWYCSYAGHVSFFSVPTFRFIGGLLAMDEIEHHRLPHMRARFLRHVKQAMQNWSYFLAVSARGFGQPQLRRLTVDSPAPSWTTARDHCFYAMRRKELVPNQ